jgi:Fic family protein
MLIPPKYFLTPKISELLAQIEANRQVINHVSIPPEIELNIRRKSTLKSSIFSARIEGNSLTLDELSGVPESNKKKIEINNVLRSINYISEKSINKIYIKDILGLHSMVMKGLQFEGVGKFRKTHEGVFTTGGTVIYHAPPPSLINSLVGRLIKYTNSSKERFIPIKAVLIHYVFEKIHPFVDGSGRVGRLLMLGALKKDGYGFKGILPFEEQIDKHREEYYRMLEEPERDVTNYIEFMLTVIKEASEESKNQIIAAQNVTYEDLLLPRRAEILRIINEHKVMNFDSIKRRFSKINERTLRYDIKKLTDGNLLKKLGTTRGVYYKTVQE